MTSKQEHIGTALATTGLLLVAGTLLTLAWRVGVLVGLLATGVALLLVGALVLMEGN